MAFFIAAYYRSQAAIAYTVSYLCYPTGDNS